MASAAPSSTTFPTRALRPRLFALAGRTSSSSMAPSPSSVKNTASRWKPLSKKSGIHLPPIPSSQAHPSLDLRGVDAPLREFTPLWDLFPQVWGGCPTRFPIQHRLCAAPHPWHFEVDEKTPTQQHQKHPPFNKPHKDHHAAAHHQEPEGFHSAIIKKIYHLDLGGR